jgi:hypothetical protein
MKGLPRRYSPRRTLSRPPVTVRNLDAWYAAFDVKPADKLYLAPADRVRHLVSQYRLGPDQGKRHLTAGRGRTVGRPETIQKRVYRKCKRVDCLLGQAVSANPSGGHGIAR